MSTARLPGHFRMWRAVSWLVLVFGIAGAAFAGAEAADDVRREREAAFRLRAADVTATVAAEVQRIADFASAQRSLVLSVPDLTNARFRRWFESMEPQRRLPTGIGTVFIERVAREEIETYLRGSLADPDSFAVGAGGVYPPGEREEYCLARFGVVDDSILEVLPPNMDFCAPDLPGVDRSPTRAPALLARDTGEFTIMPPFADTTRGAFALFAPVYGGGTTPTSIVERRASLVGWIAMTYDGTELARSVLRRRDAAGGEESDLDVDLFRRQGDRPSTLVASFGDGDRRGGTLVHSATVQAEGAWQVRVTGGRDDGAATAEGRLAFAVSLTIAVLLFAVLRVLAVTRERALRLVEEKTAELRERALHDPLTGLANRALLVERARDLIARHHRGVAEGAALFIDLDGFKGVNDAFGHEAGDELLQSIASRLERAIRTSDTAARIGGDEFVVLVDRRPGTGGARALASRLLRVLAEPAVVGAAGGASVAVSASIGIADADAETPAELLHRADVALYDAKAAGKDRVAVYGSDIGRSGEPRPDLLPLEEGAPHGR